MVKYYDVRAIAAFFSTCNVLQPVPEKICLRNSAKSGFFRARFMPFPAKRGPYRGFRKRIVSVFTETVAVMQSRSKKTGNTGSYLARIGGSWIFLIKVIAAKILHRNI